MRPRSAAVAGAIIFVLAAAGCGRRGTEWKIEVDNKTTAPCSVRVDMDFVNSGVQQTSEAHIDALKAAERLTLISGTLPTMIRSVKVTNGDKEQALTPEVRIQPGQTYRIVVPADGQPVASFDGR